MNKKIIAIASVIMAIIIVISGIFDSSLDKSTISQTIFVDAIYEPKTNFVKITYSDNSEKTKLVTLEILGMEKTFHKEFSQNSFVEIIQFNSEPKYKTGSLINNCTLLKLSFEKLYDSKKSFLKPSSL